VLKLCAFGPSIRAHHSQPWRQDGGSLCYNRARSAPSPMRAPGALAPMLALALRAALRSQAALVRCDAACHQQLPQARLASRR